MGGFLAGADLSANRIETARRQAALKGYIDLTSSNPTLQGYLFPPDILRAAADPYWVSRRYNPDPRGLPLARTSIAQYYAARQPSLAIPRDDIFITASTSEAYGLLFALLTEPGDNLLAPTVTYPLFEYLADIYHVELRPYRMDESRAWQIDPTSVYAQTDERTRAVLVISPHNPTGMIVQKALTVLCDLRLPVICDEVFAEFTYRAGYTPPFGTLHPDLPVFHLNGISKMFALPDLKLGWIALNPPASAHYAERLEMLNDTFLGANTLTQSMLPALFEQGGHFVAEMRNRIRANLDTAIGILDGVPGVHVHPPDGGYYLFPEVTGWQGDEEELVLYLLDAGVLVHPGFFYGCERGVHLMLSCLTEPNSLQAGLVKLSNAILKTVKH
jgi:aspartate/methionine/tyrosine aminotransferase